MKYLNALSLAALLALSTPALASGDNCTGLLNTGCNDVTNNNPVANGGAGGSAVNAPVTVNTNTALGGTAKIERGAVDVDTYNLNTNVNKTHVYSRQDQDQKQGQLQGQQQKVEDSGNSSIAWTERRQTASAYAGAANISLDSCATGMGAGAQGPAFGVSLNFARDDIACDRRKNAVLLNQFGYGDAAIKLLCQDDDIAQAMAAAGKACR